MIEPEPAVPEVKAAEPVAGMPLLVESATTAPASVPPPPVVSVVSKAKSTVAEDDEIVLHTAGQRRVNLIWEVTQSAIALSVVGVTLWSSYTLALRVSPDLSAFVLLSNAFFLVIGFYFGRTNHTRVGGITDKDGR